MMNEEKRIFDELNELQGRQKEARAEGDQIFRVGEEIKIKGRRFVIRKITKKDLVLRPTGW